MCLVRRGDSLSTTSSALAAGLHQHISLGNPAQQSITAMLYGSCLAGTVTVATSRVPDFSELAYRQLGNGFRELGDWKALISSSDLTAFLPSERFDPRSDIPSVDSQNPSSLALLRTWHAMEVNAESLFILIFLVTPTIHSSHRGLAQCTSLPNSFPGFCSAPAVAGVHIPPYPSVDLPPSPVPVLEDLEASSSFHGHLPNPTATFLGPDGSDSAVCGSGVEWSSNSVIVDLLFECVPNYVQ
ncbi:hypothetical protein R3P38DRAFT_2778618 [Favolaschia claudopus]|uniref:Uncharacterized protein n=1 Tax=Favolaschia claudopus TaxID=2862362 RepID=A0AAW0BHG4_9AGAR